MTCTRTHAPGDSLRGSLPRPFPTVADTSLGSRRSFLDVFPNRALNSHLFPSCCWLKKCGGQTGETRCYSFKSVDKMSGGESTLLALSVGARASHLMGEFIHNPIWRHTPLNKQHNNAQRPVLSLIILVIDVSNPFYFKPTNRKLRGGCRAPSIRPGTHMPRLGHATPYGASGCSPDPISPL